jgi:hypothetical protein
MRARRTCDAALVLPASSGLIQRLGAEEKYRHLLGDLLLAQV